MITAFLRTLILYLLIMAGLRLLGKRQIGELEPSELVLTLMLSDLATVPMQDFGIPLLAGIIPICTLLSLSMLTSQFSLRSLKFRQMVCGTPSVLIRNGVIQQQTMRENRYTLDELLEELREQGYCSLDEIKYAVLENSGQLSLLPWTKNAPATPCQTDDDIKDGPFLPIVLINDGQIMDDHLQQAGKTTSWISKTIGNHGISSPEDVFLLTVDEKNKVTCVKKEPS